jgi:hypothetical protein
MNPGGGVPNQGMGGASNPQPGAGGFINNPFPGVGGSNNPSMGGSINPGAGGFIDPGAGGINPGAGGVIDPGAGGVNPGSGGSSGGVTLVSCDQTGETPDAPITKPCGDFKAAGAYATRLQLGPYGGQMDVNVGKGFENPDPADSPTCGGFAAIFGEDPTLTSQLLNIGPQPCNATAPNTGNCLDQKLYTVYKPAIWPAGPVPVLTWGNGTCAQPEGYGALLRYIASYGFFVVAANSREAGTGANLRHGLDFAAAANADSSSPYFGHLDMTKVGVMGHSQGSSAANSASTDSRIKSVILFNGGTSNAKPFLAVSGDLDIGGTTAAQMAAGVNGSAKGASLYFHNPQGQGGIRGHLVLMLTPQRVTDASLAFWQMTLNNDATARNMYVGSTCGLCGHSSDYEFVEKGF